MDDSADTLDEAALVVRSYVAEEASRLWNLMPVNCSSATAPYAPPLPPRLPEQFVFPRRIFFPLRERGPLCVCDYQFSDEDRSELPDRLKEMLDIDALEEDLITDQETQPELVEDEVPAGDCGPGLASALLLRVACETISPLDVLPYHQSPDDCGSTWRDSPVFIVHCELWATAFIHHQSSPLASFHFIDMNFNHQILTLFINFSVFFTLTVFMKICLFYVVFFAQHYGLFYEIL